MKTKQVRNYTVQIFVGTRPGYQDVEYAIFIPIKEKIFKVCQDYCDMVGLGVTITDTQFVYTEGNEPGVIIGLINYARFPKTNAQILDHAKNIAEQLLDVCEQERLTILTPDNSILMEK